MSRSKRPEKREGTFERQIARETPTTIERDRRDPVVVVCQRINDRLDQFAFRRNLPLEAGGIPGRFGLEGDQL